jgi:hypothetical protein
VRTLGAFFAEQEFPQDQESRIARAASQDSVPARALRSYATKTRAYLHAFEKRGAIPGARLGTPFYRKRAIDVLIDALGKGKARNAWPIYRQAAMLFVEKELSKLNTLLLEVPAPAGDPPVAEALKLVCSRTSEYNVSKDDLLRFYELWGFERVPDFESLIDEWMKPDEHALQRRQLAALVTQVSDLKRAVTDVEGEAAALRQLIGQVQQTQAAETTARTAFERKLEELVSALVDEVRRGEGRLKALEDCSKNSVATSTLESELRRIEAATKAAISTAIDARPVEIAAAFNVEVSRATAVLEGELRALSSKLSAQTGSLAPPKSSGTFPFAFAKRSRSESITDGAALRRVLTSAARARGVGPSIMLQIHAAVVARLTPVTLGPAGLAALTAYAEGVCGGRLLIIHVSPNALQPRDLDDTPGGGIAAAVTAAKDIEGLSLVVLEGANRSPLEASFVPLLQIADVGLSPLTSARGLRLGATLVAGATTVPVCSQLWSYATAIYPEHGASSAAAAPSVGALALSSEFLTPGTPPAEIVDELIEAWPDCRELRPAMARLAGALTRLYDKDRPRITAALLHGIILPYVVTSLNAEEQAEALSTANADGELTKALRILRRRLC